MKYESYLMLSQKVKECPQIITYPSLFERELSTLMEVMDEKGYSELIGISSFPELSQVVRPAQGEYLTAAQREQNLRTAKALLARLRNASELPYESLWGVNCWMNALAWPFCMIDEEYLSAVRRMETQDLEERLEYDDDGYAAAVLAERAEKAGDTERALKWLEVAYDHCNVLVMRSMERAAIQNGVEPQALLELTERHAALGDAYGIAEYAICLIQTGRDAKRLKHLAMLSADMGCPAGYYALYLCLADALDSGEVPPAQEDAVIDEMARLLTLAADGGDLRARRELEEAAQEEMDFAAEPQIKEEPQPEEEEEEEPDCAFPVLWQSISEVLSAADDAMIEETGDPVEDDILIDLMLACLCGAMRAYDTPAQALAAKETLIVQFDMLMPDFAGSGYDQAALRSAFDRIAEQVERARAFVKRETLKKDEYAQLDWKETCICEAVAIGMMFGNALGLSEPSKNRIYEALTRMMHNLIAALNENE